MADTIEIKVPDIGGYDDVPVIEVLVAVGDTVARDQGLVTLESDKATMEVPAPEAGVITALNVKVGDTLSEGSVVATLRPVGDAGSATADADAGATGSAPVTAPPPAAAADAPAPDPSAGRGPAPANTGAGTGTTGDSQASPAAVAAQDPGSAPVPAPAAADAPTAAAPSGRKPDIDCALVVIGSGPGGYAAAFRAADLGVDTVLIERHAQLGGVCLNVGCIPSKALLHAAAVIDEAAHAADFGIRFGKPEIALDALRAHKARVVGQFNKGLAGMAKQRKVRVQTGNARFVSANELELTGADGAVRLLHFAHCIVAAGSQALKLPGFPWDDPRVMDSTDALELADVPARLLVVGGGIIGLEMATVYRALGSAVTVVELADQLMPGADPDLVKPLADRLKKQGVSIHLKTKVVDAKAGDDGITCAFEGEAPPAGSVYDCVLVAVGRTPNGGRLDADKAGVQVGDRGFIAVDAQMRTNVPHVLAIGDVIGQPMLAHKATHEGHLAAEVVAGLKREWVARVIPSVAYTDPEIAWVGVTEGEARAKGLEVGVGKFPWAASARAVGIGRSEGFTKLLFDEATHRIVGAGIVGKHAGDLISELALAIEMGAEAADIAHTIHPHPTLSESVGLAAEVFEGTITDLYVPKKK